MNNYIDREYICIGVKIKYCKNYSLSFHLKCVNSFYWKHNLTCYYWYNCIIGENMIGDGYPYKFVTFLNSLEYYCFLKTEDTVYELITDLLK